VEEKREPYETERRTGSLPLRGRKAHSLGVRSGDRRGLGREEARGGGHHRDGEGRES